MGTHCGALMLNDCKTTFSLLMIECGLLTRPELLGHAGPGIDYMLIPDELTESPDFCRST